MLVNKSEYIKNFFGYTISGCVVRNKNIFYFVAIDENSDASPSIEQNLIEKRVIAFLRGFEENKRYGLSELEGMDYLNAGVTTFPKEQFVGVDSTRQVFKLGSGEEDIEEDIPLAINGPARGPINDIKQIDGYLYAASFRRGLARRVDANKWESLCPDVQLPTPETGHTRQEASKITEYWGFDAFDGFSSEDIYAAGGKGDVWHYYQGSWQQIDFPSNDLLSTVCCAGNDNVYIGAQSGTIYVGKGLNWKRLYQGDLSLPYRSLVWFEGNLYGSSSYGLWVLDGDEMVAVDLPENIKVCAGRLSVADGVMLMAGQYGAAFLEDGEWQLIFNVFQKELKS